MQARHIVYKGIPPGWQYEQARSVCKALFNHAIHGIYEGFFQVVLDFIWVVYKHIQLTISAASLCVFCLCRQAKILGSTSPHYSSD
jgi:hypothetical protein